jgi:hypothetical protein
MQNIKQFLKSRRSTLLLLAGAVTLGLTIAACDKGTNPTVVANPCADNAALCIPRATMIDSGEVYFQNCTGCHGMEGRGYAGATPPLANSDFFMNNRSKVMAIVLLGYDSAITVNGMSYQSTMPTWAESLSDFQIASILTYLRAVRNDSTVVSCNATQFDDDGFAVCTKVARTPAEIAMDSVAVWEVAHMRDSLDAPAHQP